MKNVLIKYLSWVMIAWGGLFVFVFVGRLVSGEEVTSSEFLGYMLLGFAPMTIGYFMLRNYKRNEKKDSSTRKETMILQLARNKKGRLSEAETAVSLMISLEDSRLILQEMCTKGYAEAEVDDNGFVVYIFRSFLK